MKRFISIFLCASLLLLSGCTAKTTDNKNVIAVSFYPVYILTLNVTDGIDGLSVECMADQSTGCLHDYTVTAKDARLLSDCRAFIINGAGMEAFVEDLYETVDDLSIIDSSEGASVICAEAHEEEEHHQHAHNHSHSENAHIWMSVDNAILQVENICNGLVAEFPQYEAQLVANAGKYIDSLLSLKEELSTVKKSVQGKSVVTFHNAYEYLFSDLGVEVAHTIESGEGGEPSAKALGELSEEIVNENIKSLFIEPGYEGSSAEILSNETGAQVYTLNPVLRGAEEKTAYEDIMRENLQIILKAVK